ncbi:ABC transporter ATP-binding protein [Martelella alba]|uniref:ABC transporter ATP-binding protein n=1 Tax=Martelella alba TaxID=2590451 RepID=A0A506UCS6_9HYPH|nr:ABC transporter ATP-binding protein [Martelella alba]TPW32242.1 ABC transporter ATP-binding protein [Martelella alba]
MTNETKAPGLLTVSALHKSFAGVHAVEDMSFDVPHNTITGIIGPNGSGKSTTIDCLSGFQKPDSGSVILDGTDITGLPAEAIAKAGLIRTFQTVRIYEQMTLKENLLQAMRPFQKVNWLDDFLRTPAMRRAVEEAMVRANELTDMIGLRRYFDAPTGILSYGQKKLVALAAGLMVRPKLLILDEPVAGVNPSRIREIEEVILNLHAAGESFVIVEHNVEFVMRLSERVVVFVNGTKMTEGDPATVQNDQRVLEAYLGNAS